MLSKQALVFQIDRKMDAKESLTETFQGPWKLSTQNPESDIDLG
jgi:hypothetical protein